uniref:Uncharacterized protein n=1 Tax=Oryctolagus cuniculus TaxID=9986 RepID=A0A5F9C9S0_RABIT
MGAVGSSVLACLSFLTPHLPTQSWPTYLRVTTLGLATVVLGAVAWHRIWSSWHWWLHQVDTVAQLWIYPVKSCTGVLVNTAEHSRRLRRSLPRDRYCFAPEFIVTAVDPDTGVVDKKEALETLESDYLCDPSEHHIQVFPLWGYIIQWKK